MSLTFAVQHHYNGFDLDIELQLETEGITALFGPSGCGKSTLLRLLAGLEPAQQGRIHFHGECWQDSQTGTVLPANRRDIGLVFQDARLFPHLSVQDNLSFSAPYRRGGMPLDASLLIDQLQLAPLLLQKPDTLSGGQKQRVALARALLSRPRLLLLDEPLSALDRESRRLIMDLIEQLQQRHALPIIYVTHAVDEVLRLADHLVCLQQGKVIAEGDPLQLFGQQGTLPQLGNRALLRGRVAQLDIQDRMSAISCGRDLPPIWIAGTDHAQDTTVTLSLQAEDIALSLQPLSGTSLQNQLPVELVSIDQTNSDRPWVQVRFGDHLLPVSISHRALTQLELRPGQQLWALIKSIAVEH
ncbi:molybdenum ABC transporter ATP-binding protein [Marinobacterium maritimum]|uniref:Molybdenum ABC transporter ATP-binding protein n=1 Tax=Marinobacterium maritimum TaxID=500162 RepID=A0ABP3TH67_9GAMM